MSYPCVIYKFNTEMIALSELTIMSPDFSSNFCYDRASTDDEWNARVLILTPFSFINGLILDYLMLR
jgi:hypothetical protein